MKDVQSQPQSCHSSDWLCLSIGNSRLHWAWFRGKILCLAWNSHYLNQPLVVPQLPPEILPSKKIDVDLSQLPLCLASVVREQTQLWQNYPNLTQITLQDIPLNNKYSTLGIDRALAVWGAGVSYGFPCLVIDAGTALTFTGVNSQRELKGGAILPGLRLQLQSLSKKTSALPAVTLPPSLPKRWALNTPEAIESGVVYTVLAGIVNFIADWHQQFPHSQIILTGGDAGLLAKYLQILSPKIITKIIVDLHVIFWGMQSVYQQQS